jgi:glycosyltransferase involved in cell wall biosynthesis
MEINNFSLTIVIPCHNESVNVIHIFSEVMKHLSGIKYALLYVNDHSTDDTLEYLQYLKDNWAHVDYINTGKRVGQYRAVYKGLGKISTDYVVVMDCDLEHHPKYVPIMYELLIENHYSVIYSIRKNYRDGLLKNIYSPLFYLLFRFTTGIKIDRNLCDFMLFNKGVLEDIKKCKFYFPYLKAYLILKEYECGKIYIDNARRRFGNSKYCILNQLCLALNSILQYTVYKSSLQ